MTLFALRVASDNQRLSADGGRPSLGALDKTSAHSSTPKVVGDDQTDDLNLEPGLQRVECMRLHPPSDLPLENRNQNQLIGVGQHS